MGEAVKVVAKNSKAYHDYFVEEKFEAGIELAGTEVKSIRLGNVNLKDSFCIIKEGQLSVLGMHISPYEKGNIFNKDPRRPRRGSYAPGGRSCGSPAESSRTATPSSPCPSISRAHGSNWSLGLPRARSSMTSGSPPPSGTPSGK